MFIALVNGPSLIWNFRATIIYTKHGEEQTKMLIMTCKEVLADSKILNHIISFNTMLHIIITSIKNNGND